MKWIRSIKSTTSEHEKKDLLYVILSILTKHYKEVPQKWIWQYAGEDVKDLHSSRDVLGKPDVTVSDVLRLAE